MASSLLLAYFINGVIWLDSFCRLLFIFQLREKNVIFNYRWWLEHVSPCVPPLSMECKILAGRGKHVLVSEEASFPKGHI